MNAHPAAQLSTNAQNNASSPRLHRHRHHWWYIWIPIFASFIWPATLLALLITWLAQGRPHYVSMDSNQTIAYISDIAADILKPLFIVGCSCTAVGLVLSLSIERWARHEGRLLPNMRRREKVMSTLAIIWSIVGGAGLILLSIFDTKRHDTLHHVFLFVFVLGTALSAIFTIIEFRWLDKTFGHAFHKLRTAYIFKAAFVALLIILAIVFGVLLGTQANAGAVVEWVIAFLFTFYLLSFWFDLRQSRDFSKGELTRERVLANGYANGNGTGQASPDMVERGPQM